MVNSKLGIFIYMILLPVLINLFYWISYFLLAKQKTDTASISIEIYSIAFLISLFIIVNVLVNIIEMKIDTLLFLLINIILVLTVIINSVCFCVIIDKIFQYEYKLIDIKDYLRYIKKPYIINIITSNIFNIILIIQSIKNKNVFLGGFNNEFEKSS